MARFLVSVESGFQNEKDSFSGRITNAVGVAKERQIRYFEASCYQDAWDLYHFMKDVCSVGVPIDIIDNATGEIIQSSEDEFED